MKNYYRIMLGQWSKYAKECFELGVIGTHFGLMEDLTERLPDEMYEFNQEFIPIIMANWRGKTKIGAGLACGAIWTVSKGLQIGDFVLCPDGEGAYMVGEVIGNYEYVPDGTLPHQRRVRWLETPIPRQSMSGSLKRSTASSGTVCNISKYAEEIETLLGNGPQPDPGVEDTSEFAMEKHLEDFLVANWDKTELGKEFAIFEDENGIAGQQFPTDTGPLDILAVSRDKKRLLVVELKRGKASDVVVGQILRYMGFVKALIAEEGQTVEGMVIAIEDDLRLKRALLMVPAVKFLRYQVSFKLVGE